MARAEFQGTVIADSDETVVVDGNHYFPAEAVQQQYLRPSSHTTVCGWKGTAGYHDVVVGNAVCKNAAWHYADPKPAAQEIAGRIAFWKDVKVSDSTGAAAAAPLIDEEACRVHDR
ncbi:MAG: DUF427 domain-containing protein [Planctomycetales bacterium]|nr:DUF427 domain-containing protein [Planctomycetales bacterium]